MDSCCYLVSNISKKTRRESIWKTFEDFGSIKQLQLFSQGEFLSAVIIYIKKPLERLFLAPVVIDKHQVTIRQLRFSEYMESFTSPVTASKLSFGGLALPTVFIEEWSTDQYITFDANVNEKYIEIFFAHMEGYYRLRIHYNESIESMLVLQRHHDITTLNISAKYPPLFWRSRIPMEELTNHYDLHNWERVTEIPIDDISRDIIRQKIKNMNGKNREPVTPYGEYPDDMIQLNLWTVYRLEFNVPLRSFKLNDPTLGSEVSHEMLENKIWAIKSGYKKNKTRDLKIPEIRSQKPTSNLNLPKMINTMSFEVQYMMEHAFNLKILREYNIETDFFEKMKELPPNVSCTFLSLLSAPQERIYNPDTHINHIYQLCKNQIAFQIPIPDDCFLRRSVIITPTSMYPLQPTIEPMNQLQARYKDHADRFLYVEFTDEDLAPIKPVPDTEGSYNTDNEQNGKLYDRVYNILRRGIRIAGRTYEFVGSSLKELKSHSCWFFAPTEKLTRNMILENMGDFREVKTISKFTNYTGLFFMPRLTEITLAPNEIEEIEDFVDEYGNNFTVECGKMSPAIAREIARELDLDQAPSVVQFNICGFKGILMLSNYLVGRKIQLRTSQYKFDSADLKMSISKYSISHKVYLDWHKITILSSLGVRYHYLEEILQEEIQSYEKPSQRLTSAYTHILDNQYYLNNDNQHFANMMQYWLITPKEPFISNLLTSFENKRLMELKKNCKIFVNNAAKVFAIMDETGSLCRGEVFLQVVNDSSRNRSSRQVIQGQCAIFRENSCFVGDVRVFNAVDHPKLRHYTNVLVFPNIELCDLPSLCSNDEPDEDNFTVIWDRRLIPASYNLAQRKYQSYESPVNLRKVAFLEAAKFFTTYVSKDIYHIVKEAYVAIADNARNGIFHGNCNYLANQLCHAIDFARTGVYASLNGTVSEYAFPNFMEKNPLRSYISRKPLGYLYELLQNMPYNSLIFNYCKYDDRLHIEGMYKYILEARKTKAKYDYSLRLLLGRYSIKSEVELVSGNIVDWPKYINLNQRDEFVERAQAAFSRFRTYWKEAFYSELGINTNEINIEALKRDTSMRKSFQEKAAAWYYVTYHPSEFKNDVIYNSTLKRYLSFPWVMAEYIIEVTMQNNNRTYLEKYSQPVSLEKMKEHAANLHTQSQNIILYESDDEGDDEDEDDFSEEEVIDNVQIENEAKLETKSEIEHEVAMIGHNISEVQLSNEEDDEETDDDAEVPVVNVRLADLM